MNQLTVIVGSESELKIRAVEAALAQLSLSAVVSGCAVISPMNKQPVGFDEMWVGAMVRAVGAETHTPHADINIGIENGIVTDQKGFYDAPMVCVNYTKADVSCWGYSVGTFFPIPERLARLVIKQKSELGEEVQKLAQGGEKDPMKYFSKGFIAREKVITLAVMCALVKVLNQDLYA